MTLTLRIILILFSIFNFIYTISSIKKHKLNIDDSLFFIILSVILLLMSIFTKFVTFMSKLLGFYSTSNFVLVFIAFLLMIELFNMNNRISLLNEKIKSLNHYIALKEKNKK